MGVIDASDHEIDDEGTLYADGLDGCAAPLFALMKAMKWVRQAAVNVWCEVTIQPKPKPAQQSAYQPTPATPLPEDDLSDTEYDTAEDEKVSPRRGADAASRDAKLRRVRHLDKRREAPVAAQGLNWDDERATGDASSSCIETNKKLQAGARRPVKFYDSPVIGVHFGFDPVKGEWVGDSAYLNFQEEADDMEELPDDSVDELGPLDALVPSSWQI